jgi:hypothetical protein
MRHAFLGVGREFDTPGLGIALDQGFKARFVNRDIAKLQAVDFARVDVDA